MSDIQFLERLGDAFETAITAPHRTRLLPRRRIVVIAAAAALALAIAAIAVAHVLSSPDELAAQNVACYASDDLSSDVTVVTNDRAPVAACADAYRRMGERVPPLVACASGSTVAVIPGAGESACARAGLTPLPRSFATSQKRVAQLSRGVMALEARRECTPPDELARGVQQLLDRQGWLGWKVEVHSPLSGPCATVSRLDGSGRRRIDGALDAKGKLVLIFGTASRSTIALLYGADGLARALEDASGTHCYTVHALSALVRTRTESAGRSATIELAPPLSTSARLADVRQERYQAGCAVITDVHPASDGRNVVAVIPKAAALGRAEACECSSRAPRSSDWRTPRGDSPSVPIACFSNHWNLLERGPEVLTACGEPLVRSATHRSPVGSGVTPRARALRTGFAARSGAVRPSPSPPGSA